MDSTTMAFALAAVSATVAPLSLMMALLRTERGLFIYASGFTVGAVGFALLCMQLRGNAWLGFIISNLLIVLFHACLAWGVRTMHGAKRPWARRFWLYLLAWFCANSWFTWGHNSYPIRAIAISACIILFTAEFLIGLHRDTKRQTSLVSRLTHIMALGYIVGFSVRIALIILVSKPGMTLMDGNVVTTYTMMLTIVFIILWAGCLLILDAERLVSNLEETKRSLETMARTDQLTGVFNRRMLETDLAAEIERSKRYTEAISIIMFDIDHFKRVNDTLGHEIGDDALVRVCKTASAHLRTVDRLYRWGGEEFLVLSPHTHLEGGHALAEKLRQGIEEEEIPGVGTITASFGVAELRLGETQEYWIKRVDRALYRAKNTGRNRVVCWNRDEPYPPVVIRMEWQADEGSGNQTLDGQHRRLLELGNELLDYGTTQESGARLSDITELMLELMERHFEDEERILAEADYPDLEEHAGIHDKVRKEIAGQRELVVWGKASPADFRNLIVQRLLVEHIAREDKAHREWLREKGEQKKR